MDQLSAMRAFVRVVQMGSFSAAGRDMNTTQTTISKKVAALEQQIGVKLLTRSSRDHTLTPTGTEYFEQCVAILGDLDEAEARARAEIASPRGTIRIAAPVAFGRLVIAPHIAEFFTLYPEIKVDLVLGDKHVDMISDGIDVAIRARPLEDSSLVARHLFNNPMMLLASPQYLARYGEPKEPEELKKHNCLVFSNLKSINVWRFIKEDKELSVAVNGNFQSDNGDVLLEVALAGIGIVQLPNWMVNTHIKSGALKEIMGNYSGQTLPFNAIYPQNRYVPLKVRCFVDFMKEKLSDSKMYK
ncbi:LysR family transcriptional regulator [Aliivibrio finisterrensis]|uniref:LysR family transcriptional regulator n=1 Tax=Aliivibrio finisterrensis TaxID=511998 RepID=A0A4Q5KJN9_9GAMM|nr:MULTISPECIES: LysR family transcriptional regulator [Aliivibrio]MDD9174397.1 LysR family transcriptional regulator [Aliivibrio sp. S3TY1]MDD9191475.1 LysR family transcriptional regulator [Aliivibrio sp. S2TY2]RYU45486.1 LysR family transcriptional regulator [Aliivibrio finisterrensis]